MEDTIQQLREENEQLKRVLRGIHAAVTEIEETVVDDDGQYIGLTIKASSIIINIQANAGYYSDIQWFRPVTDYGKK